jgi:osmotically-inducible protein OsmY
MSAMLKKLILAFVLLVPAYADEKKDDEIYDKVRLRLAGDPDVKGGGLEVEVKDGVVTIRGIVRSDKAKAKADKLAMKVKGVARVVNELRVSPTGN